MLLEKAGALIRSKGPRHRFSSFSPTERFSWASGVLGFQARRLNRSTHAETNVIALFYHDLQLSYMFMHNVSCPTSAAWPLIEGPWC